jgi:alanine dehydrogenase
MRIGVPKEIKTHEYRVGMTPGGVREAVQHGHAVQVETGAGMGIGLDDAVYEKAGATIAASADEVFAQADLIVKVKEPQPVECAHGCSQGKRYSPICTWRLIQNRPRVCWRRAVRRLPTKQ